MLLLRHKAPVLCTCLFWAVLLPVGAEEVAEPLVLRDAVQLALSNNLGLATARYAPENAIDDVLIEEAAFDFDLFGSAAINERQSAASGSALDSAQVPESEGRDYRAGVEKRIPTGAAISVDTGLNRFSSNNNAARNPDYSSDVGLNVRQPLLREAGFKVNLAPIARARAGAEQSLFELRSDALDLMADVETAYWDLSFALAARDLVASNVELAESLLEENQERKRLGIVTTLEVLQAETELLNQQEDQIQAEREVGDARDRLHRLMASESLIDGPLSTFSVDELPESVPRPKPLTDVVRLAIAMDDDAKAQEQAVEVARINRLVAKNDVMPSLDVIGRLDYLGRDDDGRSAFEGAYEADGYSWNVGLELRFPWGFREARARLRQAQRQLEREEIQLADIREAKALQARNAWRALEAGIQEVEVTRTALRVNQEAFDQERARFGSGLTAYRQVLEAQRDLDQARRGHLVAIIQSLRSLVLLSRVDGTILERNGFTWNEMEPFLKAPNIGDNPLVQTNE